MKKVVNLIDDNKFWLLFVFMVILFGSEYYIHKVEKRNDKTIIELQKELNVNQRKALDNHSKIMQKQTTILNTATKILKADSIIIQKNNKMLKSIYYYQNHS